MNSLPRLLAPEYALRVLFFWVLATLAVSQLSNLSVLAFFLNGMASGAGDAPGAPLAKLPLGVDPPMVPPVGPALLVAAGEAASRSRCAGGVASLCFEAGVGASVGEMACEGERQRCTEQQEPGESPPKGHI